MGWNQPPRSLVSKGRFHPVTFDLIYLLCDLQHSAGTEIQKLSSESGFHLNRWNFCSYSENQVTYSWSFIRKVVGPPWGQISFISFKSSDKLFPCEQNISWFWLIGLIDPDYGRLVEALVSRFGLFLVELKDFLYLQWKSQCWADVSVHMWKKWLSFLPSVFVVHSGSCIQGCSLNAPQVCAGTHTNCECPKHEWLWTLKINFFVFLFESQKRAGGALLWSHLCFTQVKLNWIESSAVETADGINYIFSELISLRIIRPQNMTLAPQSWSLSWKLSNSRP